MSAAYSSSFSSPSSKPSTSSLAQPHQPAALVVHVRKEKFDVYIGRPHAEFRQASRFANPCAIGKDGSREQVLSKFRVHLKELLERDPAAREELELLRGRRLGCWCKPDDCHGDILVEALEGRLEAALEAEKLPPPQGDLF